MSREISLFQACNHHWHVSSGSDGRGGAAFVGKRSSLVVEKTIIVRSYAGLEGGGMYSDEHSRLELEGVSFLDLSSGACPDPDVVCVSNDWVDSWGDGCEVYATNPGAWCGIEESNENCCVCGGGQVVKSCKPAGAGGGYYAASHVNVAMKAVQFQHCSSGLAGGAAYLGSSVSANISASAFYDCVAQDGGGFHLNGAVVLNLSHVTMERNAATRSRGGALNAAGAGGNAIAIRSGMFVNNSAPRYGGVACLWPASAMLMDGLAQVMGSQSGEYGGGVYAREGSSVTLENAVFRDGFAGLRGGGLFLYGSSLVAIKSFIDNNSAGNRAGGVGAMYSSSVELVNSSVCYNAALDDGADAGAVYVYMSTLTAFRTIIDYNTAADSRVEEESDGGGGILALSSTVELLDGSSVSHNTATSGSGGGINLADSTLMVAESVIDGNSAYKGGGMYLWSYGCTVSLRNGASVSGNTARYGGGLYMLESIFMVSGSAIEGNSARVAGGGLYVTTTSTVTLGDGTSVSRNMAHGSGGGLNILKSSPLNIAGRVRLHSNMAIGSRGIGGALAASKSPVNLGAGAIDLCHNTATVDGGAMALTEGSSITDSGDAALVCLLTVHHNQAETGNGGGFAVSGDSSISLLVSTAVFTQNVAVQQGGSGGGIFIGAASQAKFDTTTMQFLIDARATFWRLDLVDNAAPSGDGGGVCDVVSARVRQSSC